MAIYYNNRYSKVNLGDIAYIKLTRKLRHSYYIPFTSTLNIIKVSLYKVLKKVSKLVYQLDLLFIMKLYPIISIIYLERVDKDPY